MKNSNGGEEEEGMIITTLLFLQKSMGLSWTGLKKKEFSSVKSRILVLFVLSSFFSRKFKLPPKAGGKSYLLKAISL